MSGQCWRPFRKPWRHHRRRNISRGQETQISIAALNTASLRRHTEREILHILLTGEEHWWVAREWDRLCSEKQRSEEVQPGSKGSERKSSHQCQRLCIKTLGHVRWQEWVLREPRSHHREYPEQGTDSSTGWFQRQSVHITTFGPPGLASLVQEKRTITESGCLRCAPTMTCELPTPASKPSLRSRFPADKYARTLASAGSDPGQPWRPKERPSPMLFTQRELQHRPLLEVLQNEAQRQQNAPAWPGGTVCLGLPEGTWCLKTW